MNGADLILIPHMGEEKAELAARLHALCAVHAIPLNDLAAPMLLSTARQLRDHGWPAGIGSAILVLDSGGAFSTLEASAYDIW